MSLKPNKVSLTGFILPVGDGAVGKTSLARVLNNYTANTFNYGNLLEDITKTKNLEFEFVPNDYSKNGTHYHIIMQILVPPGQKTSEGDSLSRSYEEVMKIYRFHIKMVDVVILTYKLNDINTYNQLDFWVSKVNDFCNDNTHFVLLGSHSDLTESREIPEDQILEGLDYLSKKISSLRPNWKGTLKKVEISNLTGKNIDKLNEMLAEGIILSRTRDN